MTLIGNGTFTVMSPGLRPFFHNACVRDVQHDYFPRQLQASQRYTRGPSPFYRHVRCIVAASELYTSETRARTLGRRRDDARVIELLLQVDNTTSNNAT